MAYSKAWGTFTWIATAAATTSLAAAVLHSREPSDSKQAVLRTRAVDNWKSFAMQGHRVGSPRAPVTIVAFLDYQCPGCRLFDGVLRAELRAHPSELAVVYRNLPLMQMHPYAMPAALASECAAAQGQYQAFHQQLFNDQQLIGMQSWADFAKAAGLPRPKEIDSCTRDSSYLAVVDQDLAAARALQLPGTPSYTINDSLYIGYRSAEQIDRIIDAAIAHQQQAANHR